MRLQIFNQVNLLQALKALFKDLKVPMNYVADEPTTAKEILKDTYRDNDNFQLIDDVYFVGMVDDAAFEGNKSLDAEKIKSDYDGILIFGVTLKNRPNGLLPTRSQLAEISRAFNREFYYTPVVVIFKYGNYLAFANTERLKYKQEWREGEKAGKVSLLRDIHIEKPHSGHERILAELQIPITGTKKVDSFAKLYVYWQEVFSVSLLNKKFYQELSNWYFWATQHVTFPGEPTIADAHTKKAKLEDLLQEHRATNVIRMLTRLLFVWFVKEKKLIPEELFELDALQKDILNEIAPYHQVGSMFSERNKQSIYYKAILQNLFFATLNCPIEGDSLDKRKRGFRGEGYGTHRGIDYLMRYKQYFKNPDAFLEKLNQTVPFLNGGLFECLDDKFNNLYIDGFSDQMTKGNQLIVPDYLFFGVEEETDLSDIVGISDKKYKQAAVKGLINILKSYKFTITENTPIEEDVALDPELLGKVFENLLASYNPETKTTARKQTGSFYTPREIVNYMVDESLIAYLKNAIPDWGGLDDETLDKELHVLTSFDSKVPFADNPTLQRKIITALSTCTILDPACGSGAFPMGVLQKMVHILQKFDPDNKVWKEVQLEKARKESEAAFEIEDKQAREERLLEINEAFDQNINDPDYARKLFLIENCIYGVDIQPIAVQISKLRFFISLVVEQKPSDKPANNFDIRPLPNLETKFVAANTLIGIKKDGGLFETDEVKKLENELRIVRHKIFSLKSKERKIVWREKDKELRERLSNVLKNQGLPLETAEKLANWDPYNQNASSPFFDSEWMFGIKNGFDVVTGNPPYKQISKGLFSVEQFPYSEGKDKGKQNFYKVFVEASKNLSTKETGIACMIVQSSLLCDLSSTHTRELLLSKTTIEEILEFPKTAPTKEGQVFENVLQGTCIYRFTNRKPTKSHEFKISINNDVTTLERIKYESVVQNSLFELYPDTYYIPLVNEGDFNAMLLAKNSTQPLNNFIQSINQGDLNLTSSSDFFSNRNTGIKLFRGKNIQRYHLINEVDEYIIEGFKNDKVNFNRIHKFLVCQEITGTTDKYRLHFCVTKLNQNYLFGHTANKILVKKDYLPEALGVILNSKFLDWLFRKTSTNNHVMGYEIIQFPIPIKFREYDDLLKDLYFIMNHINTDRRSNNTAFEQTINGVIFNLYFPKHMRERGIDVLEFVEQEIQEVMQGRDFEKLNDPEKEQVIEALHATWGHPDNEVRNRIKLFAVRSPEILKPILES
ncbi:Eco57I restriction-modification methylase [Arcticibacter tournemirensis]|uniref:site-specific DNA-methyltransferase (adenine-specific) n=1 Tax=Arcticibacter tournemirensis TaxID=699437 RepID=A0A5M9HKD3_9SPHI|nr:Eco57I restriction-modification methylase domain-containing protein [Arcticibacter tournemirensis]KAA8485878.1 restriction endonuclease subunit M [Arcticibacter tournemirensis]TQM46869.1 Eco57I restriction-modification methylase [Arcticibacter tournemirensis]